MKIYCPHIGNRKQTRQKVRMKWHTIVEKKLTNNVLYLLYPQAEVENAVRAVSLAVRPTHFFDKARQSVAQLSRITLKNLLFDDDWIGWKWKNPKMIK